MAKLLLKTNAVVNILSDCQVNRCFVKNKLHTLYRVDRKNTVKKLSIGAGVFCVIGWILTLIDSGFKYFLKKSFILKGLVLFKTRDFFSLETGLCYLPVTETVRQQQLFHNFIQFRQNKSYFGNT